MRACVNVCLCARHVCTRLSLHCRLRCFDCWHKHKREPIVVVKITTTAANKKASVPSEPGSQGRLGQHSDLGSRPKTKDPVPPCVLCKTGCAQHILNTSISVSYQSPRVRSKIDKTVLGKEQRFALLADSHSNSLAADSESPSPRTHLRPRKTLSREKGG